MPELVMPSALQFWLGNYLFSVDMHIFVFCIQYKFLCMQAELQAAVDELDKTREQVNLLQTSLLTASLELEAKEWETRRVEDNLKAMARCLEGKQEELDRSKVGIWSVSSSESKCVISEDLFLNSMHVQNAQSDQHRCNKEWQA